VTEPGSGGLLGRRGTEAMERFAAVFFDLDGTLWDNVACSDAVMQIVLPKLMPYLPEDDPAEVIVRFNAALLDVLRDSGLARHCPTLIAERFRRLLDGYGVRDQGLAWRMSVLYNTARRFRIRSFVRSGARTVLEGLRQRGMKVGVITNGTPALQRNVLDALGLDAYLEHVVIGEVEGYSKPDPRLFERALALAGAMAPETLYVGDNPITDVLGASRAGMRVALLEDADASAGAQDPGPASTQPPDFRIRDLRDVLLIVDGQL